jgi:site-specific DNA-methyltransferase (adenine-specific)
MPTPEQFNLIRDRFDLPFTSIEEAEREVVGQKTAGMGSGETFGMLQAEGRNSEATKVVDITAPATPEAKQWQGWGTALKPALEPITVARKPLIGTVAENVLQHGTGAINVDGCRVEGVGAMKWEKPRGGIWSTDSSAKAALVQNEQGRWPANLIHNGSEEVVGLFPQSKSTGGQASLGAFRNGDVYGKGRDEREIRDPGYGDSGSAARFFYCAKASKADRGEGNNHPTVKPTDLMRYLCRLVTPPKGIVLDPFMGSGSTGKGAILEGFDFIGIEREEEYCKIAEQRIGVVVNNFW